MTYSDSQKKTIKIAEDFAQKLKPNDVVILTGKIGAGKTTFAKGIAKGLGVSSRVLSPTFTIARSYKTDSNAASKGIKKLYHLDLYRIEEDEDIKNLLNDYLDSNSVVVVEWPKETIIVKYNWRVDITGDETKKITITKSN